MKKFRIDYMCDNCKICALVCTGHEFIHKSKKQFRHVCMNCKTVLDLSEEYPREVSELILHGMEAEKNADK